MLKLLYHTTVDKKAYELSNITIDRPRRTNCFLLCECIEYLNMNIVVLALAVCSYSYAPSIVDVLFVLNHLWCATISATKNIR